MEPTENKGPDNPPPPPGVPPAPLPPVGPAGTEERTWAMAAHLSALVILISIPSALGPLVVWLIKKDTMPFVADQGKEALNFQLTQTIVMLGCVLLAFFTCGFGGFLSIPVAIADGVFLIVMSIIGGLNANNGMSYRYPLCWRMIK